MKKQKNTEENPRIKEAGGVTQAAQTTENEQVQESTEQDADEIQDELVQITQKCNDLNDKNLRLMAEFDNYRKRSLKERTDLIKSAGEDILVSILPVMDDFERGLAAMESSQDVEAVKQGVLLIYTKFKDFLTQRGVKEIEAFKQDFNVDVHEALTKIPAPEEELKGKVVDVIQKGYSLNDKVIRYAKVVVGE